MDWHERSEQISRVPRKAGESDLDAWLAFERILHSAFNRHDLEEALFSMPAHQHDDDVTVAVYLRTLEAKAKVVPSLVALLLNARTALARMVELSREFLPDQNEFADSIELWLDYADDLQLNDAEMKRYVDAGSPIMWMLPEQKE